MKKTLWLFLGFMLSMMGVQAQVMPSYSFVSSSGTYEEISGGTVLATAALAGDDFDGKVFGAEGTAVSSSGAVAGIDIGFTFKYNNQDMTKFVVYTNGAIQLGTGDINVNPSGYYNNYANTENYLGMSDIRGVTNNDATEVSYKVEGSAPNRVLVVQWKNVSNKTTHWGDDDFITSNHQVRLNEADCSVQVVFGAFTPSETVSGGVNFKVGVGGGSDNLLLTTGTWAEPVSSTNDVSAINTGKGSLPANGQTFTFNVPPPCTAPVAQPTGLVLSATSTQFTGEFTASASADHYLVLCSDAPITATPADGVTYAEGTELGGAIVVTYTEKTSFESPDGLSGSTKYYVAVFAANSRCMNGPSYLLAAPLTGETSTLPAAPAGLTAEATGVSTVKLSFQGNASGDKVLVAQTNMAAINDYDQMLEYGAFGLPSGDLAVGSEIAGGGKVVFIGTPGEAITLEGLAENNAWFFRAWSVDANGNCSTTYTDAATATGGTVPYEPDLSQFSPYNYESLPGWNDTGAFYIQEDTEGNKFIECNPSPVDTDHGTEVFTNTPWVTLGEGTNRVLFDLNMVNPGRWGMTNPYAWNEDDVMLIQASEDGENFTTLYTVNDNNAPVFASTTDRLHYGIKFDQFAGKTVRLRIYFKIFSPMRAQFFNFAVEQVKAVDYPANLKATMIAGGNVTLAWESNNDPAETDWEVRYKKSDESEWSEPVAVSGEPTVVLAGLAGLTNYEAQVRAKKGDQESDWTKSYFFTTGLAIPFEDTFAEGNTAGWTPMHGVLTEAGGPLEDEGAWRYNNWGRAMVYAPYEVPADDWLISPTIDLGDGSKSYSICYDIMHSYGQGEAQGVKYQIVVSRDNGATWSTNDVVATFSGDDIPAAATESTIYSANLQGITGPVKVGFYIHIEGGDPDQLRMRKIAVVENAAPEGGEFTVTYAVQEGDAHASGETVSVTANGKEVATLTFGEEGGADFTAASADSHVDGFVAYTPGNGVNGNKAGGTFYTITPKYDGKMTVAVVLNSDKDFFVLENGTALPEYDAYRATEKYYGTFDFDVKGGSSYKIYCAGSKLGFYGFNYSGSIPSDEIYIETDLTSQFASPTEYTNWVGASGYATWAAPQVTTNAGQTVYMCERYDTNCETTGDVFYQNLTGLTPGTYKIELYGSAAFTFGRGIRSDAFADDDTPEGPLTENTGIKLYAQTSEGVVEQEIAAYKATSFSEVSTAVLDGVVVGEDGAMKLGMSKNTKATNWHIVQLKGVTAKVLASELFATYIAQAQALLGEPMNGETLAQLQAAMVDNSGFTTAEQYEQAIAKLDEAIAEATKSIAAYKNVKDALDTYAAKAALLDADGQAAYDVAAIQKAYDERTLTDDSVTAEIAAKYIAAVKQQTTPGSDYTDAGSKAQSAWIGSTGVYQGDYAERFGEEMPADTIMHQTISGLKEGTYKVELYAVASQAWNSAAVGNDITVAYANDGIYPLEVIAQVACDPTASVATMEANVGSDGLLDMGMRNIAAGGNWFVIQLKSISLVSLVPSVGEAITLDIESGKDITTELAAAMENNPKPAAININLAAGGEYTVSGTIETAAPLTISGDENSIATIDASALNAPLTAISTTPYESTLNAANNFYGIGDIAFKNLKVKGLKQQLIFGNKVRALIDNLIVDNCIIEIAGGSKTTFDFNGGGVVGLFTVNNSTIYGNPQHTGQLYSSQSGQKATEVSEDFIQKFSFTSSTFFNFSYGKNVTSHRQSNQKWLSYELTNCLVVDCGKDGQFVKGLNGGQGGANPTWSIFGNSFQRIVDGAFTDISANESTGDDDEPVVNSLEGVVVFAGDYANGDFTLGSCPQSEALIGDPRWLSIDHTLVLNVESGKDITTELAAALENNPKPTAININLAADGQYTVSGTIETAAPLTISGDESSIATIDAAALSAPLAAISTTPYESTLNANNNFYEIGNITFQNVKVKGLAQPLIYGNKVRAFIENLLVENCVIEIAGGSKTTFDFNGGGVVGHLTVNNSTIYANPQHTGQLYSSQSGQKATEVSEDMIQKFTFTNCTFYNFSYGKNVTSHRQSNQKWLSYEMSGCIVVDCGKDGQFVKGLNGGQGGPNPIWDINGNSFQRIVDGKFTDISANESTGDDEEPVENNVEGVVAFAGDYANGDFTLGYCVQDILGIGDPRWLSGTNYYNFVASEWIAGDPGRISPDQVSVNEEENTITVSQTGQNNVNLLFRSQNVYTVPAEARYFIITAKGLSTNDGDSYLWWLNNTNDGGQYKPTAIYEENGETVFAWDANLLPIGGNLGFETTEFKDDGGWSTTFGMTLADPAVPAVISYIGFTNNIEQPTEEAEYAWDATLWVAGDPGRISPDKVVVDETANTITVSQTGDNNVALLYQTDKVLYVNNAKYFVIQGKGLSIAATKSYLWWLNNTNNGSQVEPNIAVEDQDGTVTLVWTIADTGLGASFETETGKTYLVGNAGWNTTFGLTLADENVPAVISYIGYETTNSDIVKHAEELTGIVNVTIDVANGDIYDLMGRKVLTPRKGNVYIQNGKKFVVK